VTNAYLLMIAQFVG